jgi:2-alkyl-3-oxoalkanoate reductase
MAHRILVTGYGGFLGTAVCRWLLSQGYDVRGIARSEYPDLRRMGVETIQADLRDSAAVAKACQGIDAVIHTAALAGVWGPRALYESINVDSTKNLLEESRRNNASAFVYCSSPSVTFNGGDQCGIDESVPYPTHWLCDYPRTKAIAEQLVLAANSPQQMLTCSLRPHLIWGQSDPHLIPRLIDRARSGRLARIGSGRNLIDTVHVENAAQAHGLALEKLLQRDLNAAGRSYFITDGEPIECWQWISQILTTAEVRVPRKSIPFSVAYAIGAALELAYGALGRQSEPPMTRFVAAQLGKHHYFNIESARRLLGYNPQTNRSARLAEMAPWLKSL